MKIIFQSKVQIDILVNNAAVHFVASLAMISMFKLKDLMQINFFAQVELPQYVSKWMQKAKDGVIINMCSTGGLDARFGYTAYASSKAALMCFIKTIAKELDSSEICANAVAQRLIETEMIGDISIEKQSSMIANSAMKNLGDPSEIADLVYYLPSNEASFTPRQIICVYGGL